jgi:branched-chain amino acid transport system permease protein
VAFWITILLSASISSIAAMGLFLQIRSGQLNVGMAVFVGIGAYASGSFAVHFGWPPVVTIPIAIVVGGLIGAAFSAITLRLHHWFFAVTTVSLSVAAVTGVTNIPFLGGGLGLSDIPIVASPTLIVLGLIASFAIVYAIDKSTIGLAIRATGDDQILSQVFGVPVRLLRISAFAVGSAIAAFSGALYAHRFGLFQPPDMGTFPSMLLFIYVIVGGKTNVFGPLLGTFFLYTMPEIVKITPETELIVYGLFMILVAVAMPGGLAGFLTPAVRLLLGQRPQKQVGPDSAVTTESKP